MALSRITEAVASFTDLTIGDDLTLTDDLLMASDANIIKFGADADVTLTHVHNTGLLLNSTSVIQFNDASQNIGAPSATVLDINATDEIELNATLVDVNANLDVQGTIVSGGTLTATTSIGIGSAVLTEAELEFLDGITAGTAAASKALILDGSTNISGIGTIGSGAITSSSTIQGTTITATTAFVPDASDGAALGTTSLEFSDLFLADAAVINLGADQDVTLTHVADTGILLNSSRKIQFSDAAESIHSDGSKLILTSNSVAFSLPTADGSSGQVLSTNGSGVLSFAAASANTPSSADGQALGSASLEWSDLFLADGGTVTFGNDQDIILTHVADVGLTLTNTLTQDNRPVVFQLKSEEDAVIANEVIASIEFAAGDSDGSDGATVAAGIHAIAEGTFSASANATKLVFTTGIQETAAASATAKMTLSSAGLLTIADDLVIKDGGTIGVASDADAITIASNGVVTFSQAVSGTSADFDGGVTIDNITIDGTEIDLSSGDLTIDVAGDIILDADGGDFIFKDGGSGDEANKVIRFSTPSHDTDEENIQILQVESESAFNQISFGGGTSALNASTKLRFLTAAVDTTTGVERISIDSSGNIVFNETGVAADFRVEGNTDVNNLIVDASGDRVGIGVAAPASKLEISAGGNSHGLLRLDETDAANLAGYMQFDSNGTNKANFQNANNAGIHIAVGTGGSITFTALGYTAANALDDYEEGTFTPILQNSGGVQVNAYSLQTGFYTKVGRLVHASGTISANGLGSAGSGNGIFLGGLPFDSLSTGNNNSPILISHAVNLNVSAGQTLGGFLPANSTNVQLFIDNEAQGSGTFTFGELSADGQLTYSIQYQTP